MNFYSHATVACWERSEPAFVLGAMLPDFASITRGRVRKVRHEVLAAGVDNHHRVDDVFHATDAFVAICEASSSKLEAAGVRRGTCRAVAHVGTELLLDGWIRRHREDRTDVYLEAIGAAGPEELGGAIDWRSEGSADRFEALRQRLLGYGLPEGFAAPPRVFERLQRALAPRKRLAILEPDEQPVRSHLDWLEAEVGRVAPPLLEELRAGLDARG